MTQAKVPDTRASVPGSLSDVADRLESLEGGQSALLHRIEQVIRMLQSTLDEALHVKQTNVDINSRLATAEARLQILEQWRAQREMAEAHDGEEEAQA